MQIKRSIISAIGSATVLFLSGCEAENHTTAHNFDFETAYRNASPARWEYSDKWNYGCLPAIDPAEHQHGRSSLRLMHLDPAGGWGYFCQTLPLDDPAGKTVELTGWIKTQNWQKGYADFWLVDSEDSDSVLFYDDGRRGVRSTSGWTRLSLRKKLSDRANYVMIGGVLNGCGMAWFDNLEVTVDGEPFADRQVAAPKTKLTRRDKKALRQYVHPLRTCEPDDGPDDDLQAFGERIGDCRMVALGENSHGSHEIFRMKDRLIRFLAARKDFGIFSIEANMPESYRLNEYVREGKGDPQKWIGGMYFWTWNTQEMLGLVEWMRRFNRPQPRIAYTGFDMQCYYGPVAVMEEALGTNAQIAALIGKMKYGLDTMMTLSPLGFPIMNRATADAMAPDFDRLDRAVTASAFDESEKAWLRQNIVLLRQYATPANSFLWRDRCMANNLLWIRRQNPDSKIIAWAHNGHVKKSDAVMGSYLADSLGNDYLAVGFTFYDGGYRAKERDTDTGYEAQRAGPGTLEYLLEQLDEPIFLLDLKSMREQNSPLLEWIDDLPYRSVGSRKPINEFTERNISDDFDCLIFIRQSSPSHILENTIQRPPKI